jgi:hypothetical protein
VIRSTVLYNKWPDISPVNRRRSRAARPRLTSSTASTHVMAQCEELTSGVTLFLITGGRQVSLVLVLRTCLGSLFWSVFQWLVLHRRGQLRLHFLADVRAHSVSSRASVSDFKTGTSPRATLVGTALGCVVNPVVFHHPYMTRRPWPGVCVSRHRRTPRAAQALRQDQRRLLHAVDGAGHLRGPGGGPRSTKSRAPPAWPSPSC